MEKREEYWVRCKNCGHKLFRVIDRSKDVKACLEIKCHSCKELNLVVIDFTEEKKNDH